MVARFICRTSSFFFLGICDQSMDLNNLHGYSWGVTALVTLHNVLGDAFVFGCKELVGYPTLLKILLSLSNQ
ncbi:hypothetical protein RYX36_005871 [Vicia faba]